MDNLSWRDIIIDAYEKANEERDAAVADAPTLIEPTPFVLEPIPPRHVSVAQAAKKRPVETALREHVKTIGWRLHCHAGFDGMLTVHDAVMDKHPRAASWLDHVWSGVGDWLA